MARQVALLRGINLGPHKRVPMADLRAALERAGYGDVRTYLQSGNVVLSTDLSGDPLARAIEELVREELGVDAAVVVRSGDELADVVRRDPFGELASDPRLYQVSFLSGEPDGGAVQALEAAAEHPERLVVSGREIFAWHPGGIARSPLAEALGKARLGVTATARNWRTVTQLLALAADG